jgi:hypothetical protein
LLAAGCASAPKATRPDGGAWREKLSVPFHGVTVDRKAQIPMRDGEMLPATVYRPRGDDAYPAILLRTPYGRSAGDDVARHFARRGYAFVVQDVRGAVPGAWSPYEHEVEDGSDTIDWIASQPWCTGLVGMYGSSYEGWVQLAAAVSGNPHLRAIAPFVSMPDPDENLPYNGGVFQMWTVLWLTFAEMRQAQLSPAAFRAIDFVAAARTLPLSDLDQAVGVRNGVLDEWLAHPPDDRDYWDERCLRGRIGSANVAGLHLTGWYDDSLVGALRHYQRLRDGASTKWARRSQHLLVGPWRHEYNRQRQIGEVDFGDDALLDLESILLRFYDCYLKGIDNGFDSEPPVTVFTLETNQWDQFDDWPAGGAKSWLLHLAGKGQLNPEPAPAGSDALHYDPADPRPTLRDLNDPAENFMTADHSGLAARPDVLDYTGDALQHPRQITGPIRVVLHVSTGSGETDWAVEVLRLTPDGRLTRLAGGIQRSSGGDIVEVDCWGASVRLNEGDRIRLRISSSDFPMYARHPDPVERRVHHGAGRPSRLLLTEIEIHCTDDDPSTPGR